MVIGMVSEKGEGKKKQKITDGGRKGKMSLNSGDDDKTGRKRKRSGVLESFDDNEEKATHLGFLLSNAEAGSVIGKGGATISDIRSQSGARVQLSRTFEYFPGTSDRIVIVSGTARNVLEAIYRILPKLPDEFYHEDGGESEPQLRIRLVVSNSSCDAIIGKDGDIKRSLMRDSGASIDISPALHDRLVTVAGSLKQQKWTVKRILRKLVKDQYYNQSAHYLSAMEGNKLAYSPWLPDDQQNHSWAPPERIGWQYQKEPEQGEAVIIKVSNRTEKEVFVTLPEYGYRRGHILVEDLTTYSLDVSTAVVLKCSCKTVQLTGRITAKNSHKCRDKFNNSMIVHPIFEKVATKMKMDIKHLYDTIGNWLYSNHGHPIVAFRIIRERTYAANKMIIDALGVNPLDGCDDVDRSNDDDERANRAECEKLFLFLKKLCKEHDINFGDLGSCLVEVLQSESRTNFKCDRVEMNSAFGVPRGRPPPVNVSWKGSGMPVYLQQGGTCSIHSACSLVNYQLRIDSAASTKKKCIVSRQHLIDHLGQVFPLLVGSEDPNGFQECSEKILLSYIKRFGVCLDKDYKYRNRKLKYEEIPDINNFQKVKISCWGTLKDVSFEDMKRLLVHGPVIGTMIDHPDFHHHDGKGVFNVDEKDDNKNREKKIGLHSILIVGAEEDKTNGEYYVVHNSYGITWGDKGFGKVAAHLIKPEVFAIGVSLVEPKDQTPEMRRGLPVEEGGTNTTEEETRTCKRKRSKR